MSTALTPGEKIAAWFETHYRDREGHWSEDALAGEIDAMLETETKPLLEALEHAKSVIRTWHDMGTKGQESLWLIYDTQSPEMKKINTAIAKAREAA